MNPEEQYANENQEYVNIQEADWREISSAEPEQLVIEEQEPVQEEVVNEEEQEMENQEEEQEEEMEMKEEVKEAPVMDKEEVKVELLNKIDMIDSSPLQFENIQLLIQQQTDKTDIILTDTELAAATNQVIDGYKLQMQNAAIKDLQKEQQIDVNVATLIEKVLLDYTPSEPTDKQGKEESLQDILDELQAQEEVIKKQPTTEAKDNLIQEIVDKKIEEEEEQTEEETLTKEEVMKDDTISEQVSGMTENTATKK
jgi:hypothetical protein